jgi:hypothetical protein
MNPQEPSLTEEKPKRRWWKIGYNLSSILVWILLVISFTGFPKNRAADVLRSSAVSPLDLIEARIAIQDELAKNPKTTDSTAVADIFNTEGWKTLERAVDAHQEHFFAIDQERRWWDRLFLWGWLAAAVGLIVFGKLQTNEMNRQWDENLPKGRKRLWGKVPGEDL